MLESLLNWKWKVFLKTVCYGHMWFVLPWYKMFCKLKFLSNDLVIYITIFFRNCANSCHRLLLDVFLFAKSMTSGKENQNLSHKKHKPSSSARPQHLPYHQKAMHLYFRSLLQHSHPKKMKRTVIYWEANTEATNFLNLPLLSNSCQHPEQMRYHSHPHRKYY